MSCVYTWKECFCSFWVWCSKYICDSSENVPLISPAKSVYGSQEHVQFSSPAVGNIAEWNPNCYSSGHTNTLCWDHSSTWLLPGNNWARQGYQCRSISVGCETLVQGYPISVTKLLVQPYCNLRFFLLISSSLSHPFQTCLVVRRLSLPTPASFSVTFTGSFPNNPLIYLIPSWHLFPELM